VTSAHDEHARKSMPASSFLEDVERLVDSSRPAPCLARIVNVCHHEERPAADLDVVRVTELTPRPLVYDSGPAIERQSERRVRHISKGIAHPVPIGESLVDAVGVVQKRATAVRWCFRVPVENEEREAVLSGPEKLRLDRLHTIVTPTR
jgi:hypothetical protein